MRREKASRGWRIRCYFAYICKFMKAMLPRIISVFICLLALLTPTKGDLVIKYVVEMAGERNDFVVKLKEGKTRADYTDWSLLIDSTSSKLSFLSHSDKTYREIAGVEFLTWLQVMSTLTGQLRGHTETADFRPTGITQKINGYESQEFAGNILGFRITLFVASDSALQQKLDKAVQQSYNSPGFDVLRELVGGLQQVSGVPIRFVFDGSVLKFSGTFESIQETDLDDFEFTIPPNFAPNPGFGL